MPLFPDASRSLLRTGLLAVLVTTMAWSPAVAASPATVRVDARYGACTMAKPCDDGDLGIDRFVHLQPAVDAVAEGGQVWVAAGTYHGSVTITRSLHLQGEAADAVRLTSAAGPALTITAATVTVSHLTVADAGDHGIRATSTTALDLRLTDVNLTQNRGAGLSYAAPGRLTLTLVDASHNAVGVAVEGADSLSVQGGAFLHNTAEGLAVERVASTRFLDSVMAAGNGTYGARITQGNSFEEVDGVLIDNGQAGLYLGDIRTHITLRGTVLNDGTAEGLGEGLELGNVGEVVLDDVTTPERVPILPPSVSQSFLLPTGPMGS